MSGSTLITTPPGEKFSSLGPDSQPYGEKVTGLSLVLAVRVGLSFFALVDVVAAV